MQPKHCEYTGKADVIASVMGIDWSSPPFCRVAGFVLPSVVGLRPPHDAYKMDPVRRSQCACSTLFQRVH